MRNLLWLLGVLFCIAVAARFHPNPVRVRPAMSPTPGEIRLSWKEYEENRVVFAFEGDRSDSRGSRPVGGEASITTSPRLGPRPLGDLPQQLRLEVETAIEEPCRGQKSKELTLTEGNHSWTVEIGTYAGPAQSRIIDLMNASRMPQVRKELLWETKS